MSVIPDKPVLEGLEAKWGESWSEQGTYLFDRLRAAQSGREAVSYTHLTLPTKA